MITQPTLGWRREPTGPSCCLGQARLSFERTFWQKVPVFCPSSGEMQDVKFVETTPLSLLNHSFGEDLIFITKFCLKMPRNLFGGTGAAEELGCGDSRESPALAAPVVSAVLITVQK